MSKLLRSAVIAPFILVPMLLGSHAPVVAQERQGCFMIDDLGQFVDLSYICPTAPTTVSASEPTLGTGDIQATLRWSSNDDLDLAVIDPSNNTVAYYNTRVASGGQLDVDANAGCGGTMARPIENIFWPPSQAPQGQYSVEVNLFSRCPGGASGAISFTLTLLVQGTTQTLTGSVSDQNPVATFPFSLPLPSGQASLSR